MTVLLTPLVSQNMSRNTCCSVPLRLLATFFKGLKYESPEFEDRYVASRRPSDLRVLNYWCIAMMCMAVSALGCAVVMYGFDFDIPLYVSFVVPLLACGLTLGTVNAFRSKLISHVTLITCGVCAFILLWTAWMVQRFHASLLNLILTTANNDIMQLRTHLEYYLGATLSFSFLVACMLILDVFRFLGYTQIVGVVYMLPPILFVGTFSCPHANHPPEPNGVVAACSDDPMHP